METKFEFIGWCKEGVHDKMYTVFWAEGSYYSGWGRRGAKLKFMKLSRLGEATRIIDKKSKKYKKLDELVLFTFFPDFKEQVSEELLLQTLSGKVR